MVLGALAALSFAAAIPLSVLSHQVANGVIAAVIGVPSAAIGILVIRRQRGNPLGWLFLASAVCQFVGTDGGGYALLAYQFGRHADRRGAVQPAAAAGAARGGPPVQPGQVRRRAHGDGVRGPAAGRG
jgi:hypothetical protein